MEIRELCCTVHRSHTAGCRSMKQLELGSTGDRIVIPESYPRVQGESSAATLRRYLRDPPHKGSSVLDPPQGEERGKAVRWDD